MPRALNSFDQRLMEKTDNYSSLTSAQFAPNLAMNGFIASGEVITTQPSDIVSNGLQLYFDAAIGNSYPQAGNKANSIGLVASQSTFTNANYSTIDRGAFVFPNSAADIQGNSTALNFAGGGFTQEVWVKHTGVVSIARTQRYITFSSNVDGPTVRHGITTSAELHCYWFVPAGTIRQISIPNMVFTNTLYQFVFLYDGTTARVYRNAVEVGNLSVPGNLFPILTGTYYLGANFAEWFEGNIYLFRYYNRALSAAEVLQNFNATRTRFGI